MLGRFAKWLGSSAVIGVTTWLAWLQVADRLPQWSLYAVLGAVGVCALLALPVGKNEDGTTRRLINSRVRGRRNASLFADSGARITGNIVNTGKGNQTVHGLPVTLTELRQYTIDVSRSVVLPEAKGLVSEAAIAEIYRRIDVFIDKVLERIRSCSVAGMIRGFSLRLPPRSGVSQRLGMKILPTCKRIY